MARLFPFNVSCMIPEHRKELKGVEGVVLEPNRTRIRTEIAEEESGFYAVATPIDGTLLAESVPLQWEFSMETGFFFKDNGFRRVGLTCSAEGKYLSTKSIPVERDGRKKFLLVGIKDSLAQVQAVMGRDKNGDDKAVWYVNLYRFGAAKNARVRLYKETFFWGFPAKLESMALVAKPGELLSKKGEIMAIIEKSILDRCQNEQKRQVLLQFVEAMAVAFLRICGQEGASLTKPELAPVPKVETPAPAAPEASAPEASAAVDPVPASSDERTATDADDQYEPPELKVVPEPAPVPELDVQAIADAQTAAVRAEKKGRTRKPKTEKSAKGKKRVAG